MKGRNQKYCGDTKDVNSLRERECHQVISTWKHVQIGKVQSFHLPVQLNFQLNY